MILSWLLIAFAPGMSAAPAPLSILDTWLPVGEVGAPYAYFALTAAGGTAPYTFSLFSGALPSGVTVDNTGLFQGTPTQLGAFSATFQVRDATTATATKTLTLTVSPPATPPQWGARGLAGGTIRAMAISPDYANDSAVFALGSSNEINRSVNKGGRRIRRSVSISKTTTAARPARSPAAAPRRRRDISGLPSKEVLSPES